MLEINTRDMFEAFLKDAQRGDKAIYYRGYLAIDVSKHSTLRDLNDAIQQAKKNDLVILFQEKLGEFQYEYRVVKT
jgi:hypothetical protein